MNQDRNRTNKNRKSVVHGPSGVYIPNQVHASSTHLLLTFTQLKTVSIFLQLLPEKVPQFYRHIKSQLKPEVNRKKKTRGSVWSHRMFKNDQTQVKGHRRVKSRKIMPDPR